MRKEKREGDRGMILSSGAIVVRRTDSGPRFLLLRAFGYWDFPKGIVETGEDPLETARREVREETGIEDLEFPWGTDFVESAPYLKGKKKARYYLAETETEDVKLLVNPEIGRPEHDEFRWVDFEEARGLVADRVRPCLEWAWERINRRP